MAGRAGCEAVGQRTLTTQQRSDIWQGISTLLFHQPWALSTEVSGKPGRWQVLLVSHVLVWQEQNALGLCMQAK